MPVFSIADTHMPWKDYSLSSELSHPFLIVVRVASIDILYAIYEHLNANVLKKILICNAEVIPHFQENKGFIYTFQKSVLLVMSC